MKVNHNRVTVRPSKYNSFTIYSTNDFLIAGNQLVFNEDSYGFSFSIPSIDDINFCYPRKMNEKGNCICVRSETLKEGVYYIDYDDSNEDEIRVNY
jgi:hypothetical protein